MRDVVFGDERRRDERYVRAERVTSTRSGLIIKLAHVNVDDGIGVGSGKTRMGIINRHERIVRDSDLVATSQLSPCMFQVMENRHTR